MSTGLGCRFEEHKDGWYLFHEQWSHRDEYDKFGPFPSQDAALEYLDANFANPGGWSVLERDRTLDMDAAAATLKAALGDGTGWTIEIIDEGMTRLVVARSTETLHVPQVYVNVPAKDVPVREIHVSPPSSHPGYSNRWPNGWASVIVRERQPGGHEPRQRGERFGLVSEAFPGMDGSDTLEQAVAQAVAWKPEPIKPAPRRMRW